MKQKGGENVSQKKSNISGNMRNREKYDHDNWGDVKSVDAKRF